VGAQVRPLIHRYVSGWMRIRGTRRRRSLDRGFVLSDHADWPALLGAIDQTGAETVWVTHGRHRSGIAVRFPRMARWRRDKKPEDADSIDTIRGLLA
jgi:hypothetical protein